MKTLTMSLRNASSIAILCFIAICYSCATSVSDSSSRQISNFDFDWKFSKGDFTSASEKDFDDSEWQEIDVPHDWSILDTFSKDNPTGRSGGFASGGVGWYRKDFTLNRKDRYSKVRIEFGGIYENSEVWINGHFLGKRPFGYISFAYDLTPYLNFSGENVIAVRVDNSKQANARWYTGSGIYRHVWLVKTNKLHIARHGVFATTPTITADSAVIVVRTNIENDFEKLKQFTLRNELYSSDNELVAVTEMSTDLLGNENQELVQNLTVLNPELWFPDKPTLYKLKTSVSLDNTLIDELETNIGIRDFNFSPSSGFSLNGVPMKFKGVNNHSDLGALGAALNDRVLERRLEILKEMGCNAIRTAHNPPSEILLHLCDSMGFMVMDEAFDEWLESWPFGGVKKPEGKAKYGYHLHFNEWAEKDLTELIKRDRNHPSVILWSVGNEIPDACFEKGTERLRKLMAVAKKLDPTRPITAGISHMHLANESGFASELDVTGYNGGGGTAFMYEKDHETYPERIFLATEVPHSYQTRGVYRTQSWYRGQNPLGGIMKVPDLADEEVFTDVPKYYSSSYDNAMVRIGARDSWRRTRDFPFMCGEFRWTGFDYLGETMFGWPAKFWNFGIIDMCGFPKDTYYFYQSQWTKEPMVHILPHWNWDGKEGTIIPVVAYSNCESVELFLDGKSLGEKEMGDMMDLVWQVPYESGVLEAKGINDGEIVSVKKVVTSGKPARIQLIADRKTIAADGQDVVHIEVNIIDDENRFVPDASNRINFRVEGEATIIAVDNGDPLNEESFLSSSRKAFNGKCLVIIKSTRTKGEFTLYAESEGLEGSKTEQIITLDPIPALLNPMSETYLKENIAKSKPRMVFNQQIVAGLKSKIRTDAVIGNVYKAVKHGAYEILNEPLLERIMTGRRLLGVSRSMLHRINLLGLVYLIDTDPIILNRINKEVLAVCKFTDWNPSHYLDVAEMSMAVAFALDWTCDRLPKATIRLAKKALIEKGIHPSWPEFGGQEYWWVNTHNNWNQVCHGGMIAASIAIADDDPELAAQTIKRSLDKIPLALSEYIPDGVYPEGPGYWTYGTSFSVTTAEILETSFGTDFGYKEYPGFMESARFKVMCNSPLGLYYNFADCGDKGSPDGDNILAWFAVKTGDGTFYDTEGFLSPPETMKLNRFSGTALAWMSQFKEKSKQKLPTEWFGNSTNPLAVFKDEENGRAYYLGAKGGHGSLNHGNMDAGSFIFEIDGVRWVIDPGVQGYNELEQTGFDLWGRCQECERWKLLTKNNFGHSTLTVNDQLHVVDGHASMIDYHKGENPEVTFDLSPVFKGQLTSAKRRFVKNGNASLLIEDEITTSDETESVTWQLMTTADIEIVDSGAILKKNGKELRLNNLSHPEIELQIVSLDPPPFKLDKQIKNLKRLELRIPVSVNDNKNDKFKIRVTLEGK